MIKESHTMIKNKNKNIPLPALLPIGDMFLIKT